MSRDLARGVALGASGATAAAAVLMRRYLREELRPPRLIHCPMDELLEEDRQLLQEVKLALRDYWPHPILEFSGYMSTFYSGLWAVLPSMHGAGHFEVVTLSDGGEASLHWYVPPRAPSNRVLLVLPGLNNDSRTSFVQATMRHLRSEGFHAVALNYRGLANVALKTPRIACAACWVDVKEVAQHILRAKPGCELFGLGYSMGGAMLLRHLGAEGSNTPFKAAVSVAAPVDFPAVERSLTSSKKKLFINFLIAAGVKTLMMRELLRSKFRSMIDLRKLLLATRLAHMDEAVVCPLWGFANQAEFHSNCTPRSTVHQISVPTLVVHAEDDPVISLSTIPLEDLKRNPRIYVAITKRGGHIGWGSGGLGAGAWTDAMAAHFLEATLRGLARKGQYAMSWEVEQFKATRDGEETCVSLWAAVLALQQGRLSPVAPGMSSSGVAVSSLDEVSQLLGENAEVSVVGRTAFMVAAERALETQRMEALFRDPFAKDLSGEDGLDMSHRLGEAAAQFGFDGWPEFHKVWTVVRTKFIDDIMIDAKQQQLVNLGAGVDTRPYRLEAYQKFKASYEVDTMEVNAVKSAFFARSGATSFCPVANVCADFRRKGMLTQSLEEAGFEKKVASVFLIEGVLDFLESAAEAFLQEMSQLAAPGSLAVINYAIGPQRPGTFTAEQLQKLMADSGWGDFKIYVFGGDRLNYGRYKEGLAPHSDWAFAVCTKM
ncbi:unnamed protein product [Effrenium voratum]|nr:unnamed protein product [Effrenium voratum]